MTAVNRAAMQSHSMGSLQFDSESDPYSARTIRVQAQYLNKSYTMQAILPPMSVMLTPEGFAQLLNHRELELHEQIKLQSLCDHYAQMGWIEVSYAGRSVREISMWVLHHVRGMNMNMLHKQCWWFEHADEAAFFKLSWA